MQRKSSKGSVTRTSKPIAVHSHELNHSTVFIPWKYISIAMALIALLLYANTAGHDFTVDDGTVIGNNKYTKQGVSGIGEIFSNPYRAGYWDRQEGLYRPLSVAMFAIEWQIGNGKPWPGHLMNILLYTLTAVVLFNLLRRIFTGYPGLFPVLATLLFIVHPIHTEVVANIKSRDEILSFLFGISAVNLLLRYLVNKKSIELILSAFLLFLGLLSKESTITFLGVIPLTLWCVAKTDFKKTLMLTLPYMGVVAIYFLIRSMILGTAGAEYELMLINNSMVGAADAGQRFATAIIILGKYLLLLIAPVTLVFDYSYNTIPLTGFGNIAVLISFIIYGYALIHALKNLKQRSLISFGILFFLGTISLVSNVFFLIEATMAERFLYTPSLGFCITVVMMLSYLTKTKKDTAGNGLDISYLRKNSIVFYPVLFICLLFAIRTVARNNDWKNNLTLLETDVKSSPESARIRYAYGSAILVEQALKEENKTSKDRMLNAAIEQLAKGVSILPNYNDAWYHLGLAYKELGDAKNAIASFEQSRTYKPFTDANRLTSSGIAYGMAGMLDKAIADLQNAVKIDSLSADAWNNLGLYLGDAGRVNESLDALDEALRIKPGFEKAYYNRGNTFAKAQRFPEAIESYKEAIKLDPGYSDAYNNLGNCYAMMNQPEEALPWFEKAVNADPSNIKAVMNLGITYNIKGDTIKANEYFAKAKALGAAI